LQLIERCAFVERRFKSPENVGQGGADDPSPARKYTKNTLAKYTCRCPTRNQFSSMKVNGANLFG
jgi:hypothetical protein